MHLPKDRYLITDERGKGAAGSSSRSANSDCRSCILVKAQRIAETWPGIKDGVTVTFYVTRESEYGPDVQLYRIFRDADGVVHTKILSDED